MKFTPVLPSSMVSTASNIMCMYWESVSDVARNITPFVFVMSKLSFLDLHVILSFKVSDTGKDNNNIPEKKGTLVCY